MLVKQKISVHNLEKIKEKRQLEEQLKQNKKSQQMVDEFICNKLCK